MANIKQPTTAPEEATEMSDTELLNMVLDLPIEPKEKQAILKQIFSGRPDVLEKLIQAHPVFKYFHKTKTEAKKTELPILDTSAVIQGKLEQQNPTAQIKLELHAIKIPEPQPDVGLGKKIKICLNNHIKVDKDLFKILVHLEKTSTKLARPIQDNQEPLITSRLQTDKRQKNEILEHLLLEIQMQTSNQAALNEHLTKQLETETHRLKIKEAHEESSENLLLRAIENIKLMIDNSAKKEPVATANTEELASYSKESENIEEYEQFIEKIKDKINVKDKTLLDNQEIPFDVRLSYLSLIENDTNNQREDILLQLLTLFAKDSLNPAKKQDLAINLILFALCSIKNDLKKLEPYHASRKP